MSSSAIGFQQINKGLTGATGNQGPQGSIGPTGGFGGPIGNTGNIAPFILNVSLTGQTAIVELSDGSQYIVSGNFSGATATDTTTIDIKDPLSPDSDDVTWSLIASGKGTNSFIMRGISGYGSLVVTETSDTIFIDSIYTPSSGSLDSFGLTNNTLVYLKQTDQISSTTIGVTSGNFYDGVLNFEKSNSTSSSPSFSKLLPRSKVKYVSPTYKTTNSQPVVLNTDEAGVFYVRTPNGISAFGGSFKSSEVSSFTIITESDDIWNFPSNVYFQNGENYLTCGKSIINLTSFDQGTSWYATVAARGVDASVTNCQIRGVLGSCCYTGVTGARCVDYVTKNQCDILSGTFNPLQACETACGSTLGVCCSNGQCIEDANYAECLAFGGKFLFGVTCGSFGASQDPNATNGFRLCYDRCQNQKVACCKDGVCLGDEFTKIECENILDGVAFVAKACSEVDCCEQNVKIGACCKNQECSQKTLNECKANGGVFMGEGELCENINCKCIGVPDVRYGNCCYCAGSAKLCKVTTEQACETGVWTFDPLYTSSGPNCNANGLANCGQDTTLNCGGEFAKCCYCGDGETICFNATATQCAQFGGILTPGIQCGSGADCDPCTSKNGTPCEDCVIPVPGVCCNCNNSNQPCITTSDIKNCPSGYTGKIAESCADNACGCNSNTICNDRLEFFSYNTCPPQSSDFTINNLHVINSSSSTEGKLLNSRLFAGTNQALNYEFNIRDGILAKDFYVDINGPGFHKINNGKDLKFCLDLDLSEFPVSESIRVYILRTWYPKFFVQNYANYKNFSYSGADNIFDKDSNVITRIPGRTDFNANSSDEEGRYWGFLAELDPSKGSTASFSKEDVLNRYIGKNQQYSVKHYIDSNNISPSFTTDDLRYELNCPLFGLNTRGKGINEVTVPTQNVLPLDVIASFLNPQANTNSPGNYYPSPEEFDQLRYYHSTDIGVRYNKSNTLTFVPDTMIYGISYGVISSSNTSVNGLTYINNFNIDKTGRHLLYNKSAVNLSYLNNGVGLYRYAGYNDFGVETSFEGSSFYEKPLAVGYYPWQAILNNFANGGPDITVNSPIKITNVGHPLTMDYRGDFIDTANIRQITYVEDPNNKESPVRTTKNSAIIFDSGPITPLGYKIETSILQTIINQNSQPDTVFAKIQRNYDTELYTGAINNPGITANSRRYATGVGKFLSKASSNPADPPIQLNTYNFCITLPNYKDYIFTDENEADLSENLINGDLSDSTKGRFTNFKNKLRIVVFPFAHSTNLTNMPTSSYTLLDSNTPFSTLKYYATEYTKKLDSIDTFSNQGIYKIKFNDPSLCVNQNSNCELCSDYINADYESNTYSIFDVTFIHPNVVQYCRPTSFDPATGLGEFGDICITGYSPNSRHAYGIVSNCKNNNNCSCKGEVGMIRSLDYQGCLGIDTCGPEACGGDSAPFSTFSPYVLKQALLSQGFTFLNFPTLPFQEPPSPSNIALGGYGGFLVKLKPYKFASGGITYYYDGWGHYMNKKSLCDGFIASENDGCRSPNSSKESTDYFGRYYQGCNPNENPEGGQYLYAPYGFDTVPQPIFAVKAANKCVFSSKSCNFGSEDRQQDLVKVAENVFGDILTNWETANYLLLLDGYTHDTQQCVFNKTPDPLRNYREVVQGTCPTAFTDNFINKLVPTPDGDICIPLECSVIDCSQYQDCSPS